MSSMHSRVFRKGKTPHTLALIFLRCTLAAALLVLVLVLAFLLVPALASGISTANASPSPFLLQTYTSLPLTDENWSFAIADYNRDGIPDLYAVKHKGSSGTTEIHIIDGANPTRFLLQTTTGLHQTDGNWSFTAGDHNRDGIPDVYAIQRRGSSNSTEIHVINGANPKQFLVQTATGLHRTDTNWDFAAADYNRDGIPDVYAIQRKGSSMSTEIHIIDGGNVQDQKTFRRQAVVNTAMAQLGKSYILGTSGPNAFDCSGLVEYAYKQNSLSYWPGKGTTKTIINYGINVKGQALLPGDLVRPNKDHVMMYIGNGRCIEAPAPGTVIKLSPMPANPYTVRRYI
jgi:cell wall-associated NlpC family hydrolase